jgi:hypothetical protein
MFIYDETDIIINVMLDFIYYIKNDILKTILLCGDAYYGSY